MCSISRDPRCEECTICTARAPDAVFTVRTYGDTRPLYGPGLVRTFSPDRQRLRRSQTYKINITSPVSQVRFQGPPHGAAGQLGPRFGRLAGVLPIPARSLRSGSGER